MPKSLPKGHFKPLGEEDHPHLTLPLHKYNHQYPNWSQAGRNPKIAWLWNICFMFIFDALGIQTTSS